MIIARSPAGLARFAHDTRWQASQPGKVRPWTDDYTNLFGALVAQAGAEDGPHNEGLKHLRQGRAGYFNAACNSWILSR